MAGATEWLAPSIAINAPTHLRDASLSHAPIKIPFLGSFYPPPTPTLPHPSAQCGLPDSCVCRIPELEVGAGVKVVVDDQCLEFFGILRVRFVVGERLFGDLSFAELRILGHRVIHGVVVG